MTLESSQPLTKMSTRNISLGGGERLPLRRADNLVSKSEGLNILLPSGPVISLYKECFVFFLHTKC